MRRALKMDRDIGTIEEGKLADVIAVDGDPSRW
jgi:imidazolonepropionase-like amidohydrolase